MKPSSNKNGKKGCILQKLNQGSKLLWNPCQRKTKPKPFLPNTSTIKKKPNQNSSYQNTSTKMQQGTKTISKKKNWNHSTDRIRPESSEVWRWFWWLLDLGDGFHEGFFFFFLPLFCFFEMILKEENRTELQKSCEFAR